MMDRIPVPDRWRNPRALRLTAGILLLAGLGIGAAAARNGAAVPESGAAPQPAASGGEEAASPPAETTVLDAEAAAVPAPGAGTGPAEEAAPVVEWVSPRAPSPVAPVPASERVPRPRAVRGIYIGSWSAGKPERLDRLIALADETEVNAFVIDVKDVTGEVSYATQVPLAKQAGADRRPKMSDVRAVLERLRDHGIYPIARIVAFKDPLMAEARPEWSIRDRDGSIWEDNHGVRWVDAFNPDVWDYNIQLAREAVALGFAEIQWDYIRFPDAPSSFMERAMFPERNGRTMSEGIREFMQYAKGELADLGVELTADVFGITTSTTRDIGIGQVWEKMADVMDVLLPMVYPSHYPRGSFGYPHPNAAPYQIVRRAMDDGVERSRRIEGAALIRPWLQAFTMGEPEYGPRHIRAQIDAVYDAGLEEWILWHPAVRYPREAFADASGLEPWFSGMGASLYEPDLGVGQDSQPLGTPVRSP